MAPAPVTRRGSYESSQIVILSSIDWNSAWQRHQIFATQFAEAGREVFFVENTAFRSPRPSDLTRIFHKAVSLAKPRRLRSPGGLPPGVKVIPPTVLPPTGALFRAGNSAFFIPRLVEELRRQGVEKNPLLIVYMPTATTLELARQLNPSMLVYDCASHFAAHPDAPEDFAALERELLEITDLVVTDSPFLYDQIKPKHGNVARIHQGVPDAFLKAKPATGKWDSFCYYGTWGRDLDPALLNAVAREGFQVTFSGFIKGTPPAFHRSIRQLKPVARDRIVDRVQNFDFFLMPYTITPFHQGVIPAKLYECFAMGRPIIATPLPSLLDLKDLIYIADSPAEWARIAKKLPETETAKKRDARIRIAREHTYSKEFARFDGEFRRSWKSPPWERAAFPRRAVSETGAAFVKSFSWIAVFFAGARMATLFVQFLAARALGPSDFGQAHLIYAMAAVLQILPMLGFPVALARFGAAADSEEERTRTISTTMLVFAVWAAAAMGLLYTLPLKLAALSGLDGGWTLCLALAFLTAAELVVGGALQGLSRFRERGILEAIYGTTAFASFGLFLLLGSPTYESLIISYLCGLGAATVYGLWQMRGNFRFGIHSEVIRQVLPFSVLGALSVLALALIHAPGRILVYHLHSAEAAGIYSAYFTATIQVSLAVVNMIHTVLIPLASRPRGQRDAWNALRRHGGKSLAGACVLFTTIAAVALLSLGKKYPFHADWLAIFATTAALILMHGIASALFAARDLRGLFISVCGTLAAGIGNLAFNFLLTPRWGSGGAAASLFLGYTAGLLWYFHNRPREEAA